MQRMQRLYITPDLIGDNQVDFDDEDHIELMQDLHVASKDSYDIDTKTRVDRFIYLQYWCDSDG